MENDKKNKELKIKYNNIQFSFKINNSEESILHTLWTSV